MAIVYHRFGRDQATQGAVALLVAFLSLPGHTSKAAEPVQTSAIPLPELKSLYVRGASIPYPAENPYSAAKADLGRTLFFDPRLSADGSMSCGTCHVPSIAWKDGLPRGIGHGGKSLSRRTPTLLDVAWSPLLTWDGRMDSLELQALDPVRDLKIGAELLPDLVDRLQADPGYVKNFHDAFDTGPITTGQIAGAIATFERGLVSDQSPFDQWIAGDERAIGEDAKRGFIIFNGPAARCSVCHMGWRLTDDGFHDIGLPDDTDPGRGAKVPGEPSLMHTFKTPTLRGVGVAGPYMHDGSLVTLADVVSHYSTGVILRPTTDPDARNFDLAPIERAYLIAFLGTLSAEGLHP